MATTPRSRCRSSLRAAPDRACDPARVVSDQVRLVDVMPTILERLRFRRRPRCRGSSCRGARRAGRSARARRNVVSALSLRLERARRRPRRPGTSSCAPRRELYDLQTDPGERVNLADVHPQRADALERALADLVARISRPDAVRGPAPVDPEVEERLRALGYIGAGVSRHALTERRRADPKDRIDLYNLLNRRAPIRSRPSGRRDREGRRRWPPTPRSSKAMPCSATSM